MAGRRARGGAALEVDLEAVQEEMRNLREELAELRAQLPAPAGAGVAAPVVVAAPLRPVLLKGGLDLDNRTFSIKLYDGNDDPTLSCSKILDRIKSADPARLPKDLFGDTVGSGRRISLVQAACIAISMRAKRYNLKDGECLDLLQELWEDATTTSASFKSRLASAANLRDVISFLNESLLTDRAVREFRKYAEGLMKGTTESVSTFYQRWRAAQEALVGRSPEYQICRSFISCFAEQYRVQHDGVCSDLERSVLHLEISDTDLQRQEHSNIRNSITFDAIEKFLDDPKNRARFIEVSSHEPRRSMRSETRSKGTTQRASSSSTSATSSHKPTPTSSPDVKPVKVKKDLTCYACGKKGHGVNECRDTEKRKAYSDAKNKKTKVKAMSPSARTEVSEEHTEKRSPTSQTSTNAEVHTSLEKLEIMAKSILSQVERQREHVNKRQFSVLIDENRWVPEVELFVNEKGETTETSHYQGPYNSMPPNAFVKRQEANDAHFDSSFKVTAKINDAYVVILFDSGATIPTLTETHARQLGLVDFQRVEHRVAITGLGASVPVIPEWTVQAQMVVGEIVIPVKWHIVPSGAKNYEIPILPWSYMTELRIQILSKNHVKLGGSDFFLGEESTYTPARVDLSVGTPWEDSSEANDGIEPLEEIFAQNAMTVNIEKGVAQTSHLGDILSTTIPEFPDNKEWSSCKTLDEQMDWLIRFTNSLALNSLSGPVQEELKGSVVARDLLANVLMKIRLSFKLTTQRPYPILKDRFGKETRFDIEFADGTEETFRFISSARNHSAAKKQAMTEAIAVQEELGISMRLPPEVQPRVVLESVFTQTMPGVFRMCIDPTPINKKTLLMPMLHMGSMKDHFDGITPSQLKHKVVLDWAKAFHLIPLTKRAQELLTFRGVHGFHRMLRMPFGPKNAPGVWQTCIADITDGLDGNIRRQVDDVFIFGGSLVELLKPLDQLLERSLQRNLPINPRKIQFLTTTVIFAGRNVHSDGSMSADPDQLTYLMEHPVPYLDQHAARSLIGMAVWLNDFYPLSAFLEPFAKVIRGKDADINLKEQEAALVELRNKLKQFVTIKTLDPTKQKCMFTDACDFGISATIMQPVDEMAFAERDFSKGFVICFIHSQLLNATQRRWATIDKECFAIIRHLTLWREHLIFDVVFVFSDHKPLRWIFTQRLNDVLSSRMQRWLVLLMSFRIVAEYIPGRKNQIADVLSRFTLNVSDRSQATTAHLLINRTQHTQPLDGEGFYEQAMTADAFNMVCRRELLADEFDESLFGAEQLEQAKAYVRKFRDCLRIVGNRILFQQGGEDHNPKLYVPLSLRQSKFRAYHGSIVMGHPRAEVTIQHLARWSWWPSMEADVHRWYNTCPRCQLGKPYGTTLDREFNVERRVPSPFFKIVVDVKGPLPLTQRGNKYVFCVYDDDTHWNIWIPTADNTAVTAAKVLVNHVILTFGSPQVIKSGRDTEWVNQLISEIASQLGILQESTFPYAPQGVGGNERRHRELESFVTTLQGKDEWDLLVSLGAFATNNNFDSSIGMSPFEAMFGRKALNPLDTISVSILMNTIGANSFEGLRLEDWVRQFQSLTTKREAHKLAMQLSAKERFESKPGKGPGKPKAKVGDLVAIRASPMKSMIRKSKLSDWWIGPFEVIWTSPNNSNVRMVYLADTSVIVERRAGEIKHFVPDDENIFESDSNRFDVEAILDARGEEEDREYLVKWVGYPDEFNLWIRREDFSESQMIHDAEQKFAIPSSNRVTEPSVAISAKDVERVESVTSTRRGSYLNLKLHGKKDVVRIPVASLTQDLRDHPLIKPYL